MSPALQHGLALGWQALLFAGGMLFGACLAARIVGRRERAKIFISLKPLLAEVATSIDVERGIEIARDYGHRPIYVPSGVAGIPVKGGKRG